jgi:hypothetical protein
MLIPALSNRLSRACSVALVWALPALTDAVIFILTVYKTIQNRNMRRGTAWNGKRCVLLFRLSFAYSTHEIFK